MKCAGLFLVVSVLAFWGALGAEGRDRKDSPAADLILAGVNVRDPAADNAFPNRAIAVRGDSIVAVVATADMDRYRGPSTIVLDLPGATVIPGLVDAHAHLENLGAKLERLDLTGTRSRAEIAELVAARVRDTPAGRWILGRGWDQNDWAAAERTFPSRTLLDAAAPDHPVFLTRVDGHALWANSAALTRAGIDAATPDPEGGEIVREAGGTPSGVLIDRAADLAEKAVPPPTAEDLRRRLLAAMAAANAVGLTGVHDAGIDAATIEVYRKLARKRKLTARVYGMVSREDSGLASILAAGPISEGLFTLRCVKITADGAMGSRGALLLADYGDRPGHRGLAVTSSDSIAVITRRSLAAGFQVATHAIGDSAIRMTLDAYEKALRETPSSDPRLRIEHLKRIDPSDLPRLAPLGIIASMQPTHATSDMPWVEERLGAERLPGAYAWRSVLGSGTALALGSDFPVESHRPLLGLYAAITRQDTTGHPPDGWLPEERLSGREALTGATWGAAFAAFAEVKNGRVAPGFRADLTVLGIDPVACNPEELLRNDAVIATIVGGRVVYRRP